MAKFNPRIDTKLWNDIKQMFQEEVKERELEYKKELE